MKRTSYYVLNQAFAPQSVCTNLFFNIPKQFNMALSQNATKALQQANTVGIRVLMGLIITDFDLGSLYAIWSRIFYRRGVDQY